MKPGKRFRLASNAVCAVAAALLLALLLSAAPASQSRGDAAGREAAWLVGRLDAAVWHSGYAAWKAKHPTVPCRVFRGDGSALFIVNLWAYRCTRAVGSGRATDFFYILNPTATPQSYLDQFQGEIRETPAMPISVMQRIHDRIESLLSQRYGKPESLESAPANVAAYGSSDWRLVRVWNQPDFDVYLYIRNTPGEPAAVGLLGRDRALAQASTDEGTQLLINTQPDAAFADQIDSRLASDLEKPFPRVAAVLSGSDERPSTDNVLDVLAATLNSASAAPPELRAELLLAADRLVDHVRLPDSSELPAELKRRLDGLKTAGGMQFSWDELGDAWIYHHDLLWTVLQTAPQSEWGQDAFFLLLDHGWDTSGVCQKGADQFRTVIRQGEKFLQQFPDSLARLPVTYLVGQAYETWWSLSKSSSCSPVTYLGLAPCAPARGSARYREGAETARQKAIAAYESLLAADPGDYGTPEIRRSLARMELGIDTNQRRFYCLYN
jgi:hypothetical protein